MKRIGASEGIPQADFAFLNREMAEVGLKRHAP